MAFDFKIDIHGAYVVPTGDRLSTASLHDDDIDRQIESLKVELDDLAKRMKRSVRKQKEEPLDVD